MRAPSCGRTPYFIVRCLPCSLSVPFSRILRKSGILLVLLVACLSSLWPALPPGLLLSLVLVLVSAGAGLPAALPAFFRASASGLAANKNLSASWQQKRAAKAALPYLDTIRNNCRSKSTEKRSAGADLWQFWGVELKNPSACAIMGLRHQQNNTDEGASSYASSV